MKKIMRAIVILAVLGMMWGTKGEAADLYVRSSGGSYTTIQAAITAATTGDTVWVEDGTYTGTGNKDLTWSGKKITVRSVSNNPDNCIIDCENSGSGFYFSGAGDCGTISGFTITRGNVGDGGGGIYCSNSSPTITNCTISTNTATYGGGIYCDNSSPTITNCTISGNSADYGGGIVCYYNSSPTITNCTISGNSAWMGGGIYCDNSSPTITNCTISGNSASEDGGGIECYYNSSSTITNCTISENSAAHGGGIYCYNSSPPITNCTISGNSARWYGGGIVCYYNSSPTITNCTISGNSANGEGGGIYCEYSSPSITNNIITNNSNYGIYSSYYSNPTINYNNLWSNNVNCSVGTGNISFDPQFISTDDFHLKPSSPCIDTGSNTAPSIPEKDKDGNPRIVRIVDMGAYEYQGTITALILEPKTGTLRVNGSLIFTAIVQDTQGNTGTVTELTTFSAEKGTFTNNIYYPSEVGTWTITGIYRSVSGTATVTVIEAYVIDLYVPGSYTTIQEAINAAATGDTIWVADGTYTGTGNKNLSWFRKKITVRSENGPNNCIIDCQNQGRGFYLIMQVIVAPSQALPYAMEVQTLVAESTAIIPPPP